MILGKVLAQSWGWDGSRDCRVPSDGQLRHLRPEQSVGAQLLGVLKV